MSQYTSLGFKAYYDNTTGPFRDTLAESITGATLQQLCEDIADSALFYDQSVNTDRNYFENSDFVFSGTVPDGFNSFASGAGAGVNSNAFGRDAIEKAVGSIQLQTGTTATGFVTLYKGTAAMSCGNGQLLRIRMRVALETLSTVSERYTTYIGFGNTFTSGDMTNGCYFRYNDSVNSGKWEAVTSIAGVRTANDTGVPAVTTFSIFEVRVNPAGTSVEYYINDILVATNTLNIPTGSNYFGLIFKMEKSAGVTNRNNSIDWYDFLISLTSAR